MGGYWMTWDVGTDVLAGIAQAHTDWVARYGVDGWEFPLDPKTIRMRDDLDPMPHAVAARAAKQDQSAIDRWWDYGIHAWPLCADDAWTTETVPVTVHLTPNTGSAPDLGTDLTGDDAVVRAPLSLFDELADRAVARFMGRDTFSPRRATPAPFPTYRLDVPVLVHTPPATPARLFGWHLAGWVRG